MAAGGRGGKGVIKSLAKSTTEKQLLGLQIIIFSVCLVQTKRNGDASCVRFIRLHFTLSWTQSSWNQ